MPFTEQEIKPLIIARKNFLFCSSVDGAEGLRLHFGLIRTAKLRNLDPYHYYVMLLKNIPFCNSVDDYEKLLFFLAYLLGIMVSQNEALGMLLRIPLILASHANLFVL